MTEPAPGDYVGADNQTGEDLYICAVNRDTREVKIGRLGGDSEWLNETQARARFSYEWGAHKPIPWMVRAFASLPTQPVDDKVSHLDSGPRREE